MWDKNTGKTVRNGKISRREIGRDMENKRIKKAAQKNYKRSNFENKSTNRKQRELRLRRNANKEATLQIVLKK
jgi:hypothetical protein